MAAARFMAIAILGWMCAGAAAEDALEIPSVESGPVAGGVLEAVGEVIKASGLTPARVISKPATSGDKPADAKEAKPAAEDEPAEEPRPQVPENPRLFKFNLQDGSLIAGEMTIDQIEVETDFGKLTVPVGKIRSFTPGLNSRPELTKKLTDMIEALGGDDFKAREQAHKDLAKLGHSVRKELEARLGDDNAEKKRHLQELLKELDQQQEERDDSDDAAEPAWIRGDTIVTSEFTIVGRLVTTSYKINSKYGPLTLSLGDLQRGERDAPVQEAVKRTVSVDGTNLVQTNFKSANVKVEKGDKITVKADGTIQMTPWGDVQSTPEGGNNFGWYVPNQIPGGALVAKIGNSGKIFKVGSNKTFTAETSGTLQFAVAMQQQYATQGYAFPGQYSVKIKVDGKE